MIDQYLARRLLDRAQRFAQASERSVQSADVATSMLAESLHCALAGTCAARATIQGELKDLPTSLVCLARALENAEIRSFQPFEIEKIALLNLFHERRLENALLPDQLSDHLYHGAYQIVVTLIRELQEGLAETGSN